MSEEHRGGKFARYRSAVHRHEGHILACAVEVYASGDGLLTRTIGSEYQYRYVRCGNDFGKMLCLPCLWTYTLE